MSADADGVNISSALDQSVNQKPEEEAPSVAAESNQQKSTNAQADVAEASGGGVHWLTDGLPNLRRVSTDRKHSGSGWMGVVANRDYSVSSVGQTPLLPDLLVLILGLGALVWAWRRESS